MKIVEYYSQYSCLLKIVFSEINRIKNFFPADSYNLQCIVQCFPMYVRDTVNKQDSRCHLCWFSSAPLAYIVAGWGGFPCSRTETQGTESYEEEKGDEQKKSYLTGTDRTWVGLRLNASFWIWVTLLTSSPYLCLSHNSSLHVEEALSSSWSLAHSVTPGPGIPPACLCWEAANPSGRDLTAS